MAGRAGGGAELWDKNIPCGVKKEAVALNVGEMFKCSLLRDKTPDVGAQATLNPIPGTTRANSGFSKNLCIGIATVARMLAVKVKEYLRLSRKQTCSCLADPRQCAPQYESNSSALVGMFKTQVTLDLAQVLKLSIVTNRLSPSVLPKLAKLTRQRNTTMDTIYFTPDTTDLRHAPSAAVPRALLSTDLVHALVKQQVSEHGAPVDVLGGDEHVLS
ncbi:hypothetical protein B0H17DRAFT_1151207 [Mycena rosella]|uniref:Uncharacterized protein n=1 Tax=Mycena rosella TaxID=1033263 RepID=A0AAD7BMI2_MYCRO|nr:hypothetical protein B0H17DRAFT_1151207 [Mycena rosella]